MGVFSLPPSLPPQSTSEFAEDEEVEHASERGCN